MAGLKRKKPAPWTVEKIKAGLIVNRLEKHIFATGSDSPDLMTQAQVTAALGLLKKVHPDLAAAQVDVGGEVEIKVLHVASHQLTSE